MLSRLILLAVFLRACASVPSEAYPRVPAGLEGHPRPASLAEARALHALAGNSARRVRHNSGHASMSPPSQVELAVAPVLAGARGTVVRPTDFGADATGQTDSTKAFETVLQVFANASAARVVLPMAAGIQNMGGWTLDLSGGTYLISNPLVFPDFNGNYRISGGMLRASSSFPSDRFVIEVGTEACTPKDQQQVCSEYVALESLFVDGGHKATGCVRIDKTMGTTFGPSAFCTGFSEVGIRINGGHETMVIESWLASYYWGEDPPSRKVASSAIEVNGEDNYLTNVIIFGGQRQGVLITGGVNVLSNVHSWGGPFVINGGWTWENRILNCYVDYGYLEIVNPSFTVVADTFFLNSHTILRGSQIKGVEFRGNIYTSGNQWGHPGNSNIELLGDFAQGARCDNVLVSDEIQAPQHSPSWKLRTTRARLVMHMTHSDLITFNFSSLLLFPWIDEVTYSVTFDVGAPLGFHGALPSVGTTVSVRFGAKTNATVTMDVVQCPKRSDFGLPATSSNTGAFAQPALTSGTEASGNVFYT